jgi:hypothetical protein
MDSNIFRKSAIAAVGFFGTLGVLSVGYSAYISSLPATANSGATLSSVEWNKMVTALSTLDNNLSNLTFSGGNVGIGTSSPAAKLHANGPIIRTIAHATANGPNDETDVGQITSRVLNFTKLGASTKIRISYTDALRTTGAAKACRWEIKVDGASCPAQPLVYDYYTVNDNIHQSRNVVGYCGGIGTGSKQIQVWVSNTPGYSGADCYTGWNASTWVLEAEEVN